MTNHPNVMLNSSSGRPPSRPYPAWRRQETADSEVGRYRNVAHYAGFSLMEVIVVLAVIGIIAAIAVPRISRAGRASKVAYYDVMRAVYLSAVLDI